VTRASTIVLLAACHGGEPVQAIDAAPPDSSALCFNGQPGDLLGSGCISVNGPRVIGDLAIDTSEGSPLCEVDVHAPYCLISGTTITITGTLAASGPRPLLLVAYDTIDVEGAIDVSSRRAPNEVIGASCDDARCTPASGAADGAGGAGGAGGSFQFFGGAGGAVGSASGAAPTPGPTTADLHGGCRGAVGGAYGPTGGGLYGHSGGAVYLMAQTAIVLGATGRILANGQGGGRGSGGSGGGGGGSGGTIALDAPSLQLASGALVLAEGGGGGGGGDLASGAQDGADAATSSAATGGAATMPAGTGGAGSLASVGQAGQDGPLAPTTSTGGGGGGGGASGYVLLYGQVIGSCTISPPP
jgi:hypothetical protein